MSVSKFAGQALIELTVFGSLVILMLGLLINYGMNADFQQYGAMETFRAALQMTDEKPDGETLRGVGSVMVLRDRHVPNPATPFGVGEITPSSHSSNVTRDNLMYKGPLQTGYLPRVRFMLDGEPFDCGGGPGSGCTTAGFRFEADYPTTSEERYKMIYSDICGDADCGGAKGACLETETVTDPDTGETIEICVRFATSILVLDACEGELIDYEGCVKQASMIVDSAYCERECKKGDPLGDRRNCASTCIQPMVPPWYAQDAGLGPDGQWTFPHLEALFTDGVKLMGLQPGSTMIVRDDSQLHKTETPGTIVTTTSGVSSHEVKRSMVWSPMGAGPRGRVRDNNVTRTKDIPTESTWTVNW